jgi:3-epi-6-deoxocathasterone 23-monooxygenase
MCKCSYGSVFKTNILGSNVIISTDPEVNKVILQNQRNIFVPAYPKSIRELMGEHSILQLNGNMHKKLHSLIAVFLKSPQFKAQITKDIQHSVKQCLAYWSNKTIYFQDEVKKVPLSLFSLIIIYIFLVKRFFLWSHI